MQCIKTVKRSEESSPRVDTSVLLTHHDLSDLSKETQNLFSDYFGFKNPILDFLKETHPKST